LLVRTFGRPGNEGLAPTDARAQAPAELVKTLFIHQEGARLDEEIMSRWLGSFSDLVGLVVLREPRGRIWHRVRREIRRVGILRFADVLAFRIFHRLVIRRRDREWETRLTSQLGTRFPPLDSGLPVLRTDSPNTDEVVEFIDRLAPDVMIARCRTILEPRVFSIPRLGTFVMHPGVAPEYRNAHGCFWALANRDLDKVGMTLIRIDEGVDTGPVYGYFSYQYDEVAESHSRIQKRVVFENLDGLRHKLLEIDRGEAEQIDVSGRPSHTWGQPWLTKYFLWKRRARRERRVEERRSAVSRRGGSRA
jgi:Formyl transferase